MEAVRDSSMHDTREHDERHQVRRFLEEVNSLAWLDGVIGFLFRLLAKLAEPFLAFGLIASAIDYGSHGQFLGRHQDLLTVWVVTQGIALEGSGGIALAMSFEAQASNDLVKARLQRLLAIALMLVGGVMFFVELSVAVKGFNESTMPDWYVYLMNGLRALVSLGYIAVCRTRGHRFSGVAPEVVQQAERDRQTSERMEQFTGYLDEVQMDIHRQVQLVQTRIQTILMEQHQQLRTQLVQVVQAEVQTAVQRQLPAVVHPVLEQLEDHCTRTIAAHMNTIGQLMEQLHALAVRRVEQECEGHSTYADALVVTQITDRRTDLGASSSSSSPDRRTLTALVPSDSPDEQRGPVHVRVTRYISEQLEQGCTPTLSAIMETCRCSKNTAIRYRRALLGTGEEEGVA